MTTDPKQQATDRLDAACRKNDRKASGTPPSVATISKVERRLRAAILRARMPPSLCRQAARMVGYAAHKRLRGHHSVYPGMERMAAWGQCTERQARRNFRVLEFGKVIHVVGARDGGFRMATEWIVDPEHLKRWLILTGANPSKELLDVLQTILVGGVPNPDMRARKPGHEGG